MLSPKTSRKFGRPFASGSYVATLTFLLIVIVLVVLASTSSVTSNEPVCHEAEYGQTIDDMEAQQETLGEAQRDLNEIRVIIQAEDVAREVRAVDDGVSNDDPD